ncbi:hypothetical protein [Roseisolibacter sp. H3M3-2]|uniref:hypothetical protein n=1 Tax=Roseisolibacter sp. H3M3-2 TaxID=3031323 RepID=UPI0023DA205F|nr:hypothetical protein [Roseisolibacter sp. H3M3-2]MDF1502321.1 hypothetical protein [Roseisolibacter sp. H3M3-2]
MSVKPHPEAGGPPPRGDHVPGGRDDGQQQAGGGRPEDFAHGRHGKGDSRESMRNDEQATDTGDDRQLRTAGGGGDQAPDPNAFRENSEGRMGGAGWGSEQVGGSTVDRRPDDRNA